MPSLVPVPWQRHLYLAPSTLARLVEASRQYGANLYLNDYRWTTLSPGWRSYAQQATAYREYRAGKGPVASSPDSGQRNHMRGGAFDLVLTTARAQAACRLAGLVRDSVEGWHWNDPAAASMPIITSLTAAGGSATPIDNAPAPAPKEKPMYHIFRNPGQIGQYVQSLITGKYTGIQSEAHLGLLDRGLHAATSEEMYPAEANVIAGYLAIINPPAGLDIAELVKALDAANDDETTAILEAVGKISVEAGDPAAIAGEVKKALQGDFAAIPPAVIAEQKKPGN